MPWEKGVFKKIFKKPDDHLQNLFKQPRQWVGLDAVPEVETRDELSSAAGTNWSEPFMSMLCHQFPISPFCNSVKTFWRLR